MTKKNAKSKKAAAISAPAPVSRKREYQAMALIAFLGLLVFGRNVTFHYVLVDMSAMIFDNPHIITGFTWENIYWAFTQPNLALYQPLPNLSFMLDSHLFGGWPGGYHTVTLLWHLVTMCLFLHVMMRLINNFPVVFAATLLMTLHPLQIGVVSQIGARNEIMQGFFMLLSVEAYRRYVKDHSRAAFVFSLGFMVLAMLCKQIIVMLPVGLLLLDYWPFNRIELSLRAPKATLRAATVLIIEKTPYFVISLMCVFFAFYGKLQYGQIHYHVSRLTIPDAIYFIITGYARYVGHLFYPLRISYFEVYSEERTLAFFLLSAAVLTFISAVCLWFINKKPYLIVGWLWFFFFMLPVSGVVRYMLESIALRYMYIPAMGLYIALLMGLYDLARWRQAAEGMPDAEAPQPTPEQAMPPWYWWVVGVVAVILAVLAYWQNGFCRDTETGVMRVLQITGDRSAIGHNSLAVIRMRDGRIEEAEKHFRRAVEIQPESYVFRYYYAGALYKQERYQQMLGVIEPAVEAAPDVPEFLAVYGMALMATGQYRKAEEQFLRSLELEPDDMETMHNLTYCLMLQYRFEDAEPVLKEVMKQSPGSPAVQEMVRIFEQQTGRSLS